MDNISLADNCLEFAESLGSATGENVGLCYQCKKCSSGCPVSEFMDYTPNQIIHAARLGLKDLVLNSQTIWLCAACETCTTRCPQEIDIVKIMDGLKSAAVRSNIKAKIPEVHAFYRLALSNIRFFGRIYEVGLLGMLNLVTRHFTKDLGVGLKMFLKGKLKLLPSFKGFMLARRVFSRVRKAER